MNPQNQHPPDHASHLLLTPSQGQVGVPRRFGLSTLLILMTMYALMFSALMSMHFPPWFVAGVGIFVTVVGVAQTILFGGKNPRLASIVAGAAIPAIMGIVGIVVSIFFGKRPPFEAFAGLLILPPIGALAGYAIGGAVAGIFLWIERQQPEPEAAAADDSAPGVISLPPSPPDL